jgi:hypothetical protein
MINTRIHMVFSSPENPRQRYYMDTQIPCIVPNGTSLSVGTFRGVARRVNYNVEHQQQNIVISPAYATIYRDWPTAADSVMRNLGWVEHVEGGGNILEDQCAEENITE